MSRPTAPDRQATATAEHRARFVFMLESTLLVVVLAFADPHKLGDIGRPLLWVGVALMVAAIVMSVAVVLPVLRPRRSWLRVRLAQLALIGTVVGTNLVGWTLLLAGGSR